MSVERLESGFPLYMSLSEAYSKIREVKGSQAYTEKLFELFVRDTPFRQQDISELHRGLQESFAIKYSDSTIRRRMYDLRQDGSIVMLDGEFDRPQDRVFQWTKTKAPVKPRPLKARSVFGNEIAGPSNRDPATHFFSRLLRQVFS